MMDSSCTKYRRLLPSMTTFRILLLSLFFFLLLITTTPRGVCGRAIMGIDMGSSYVKVALVQSGSPLEIVTNMHSKRKTENMILFDKNQNMQRFFGSDAKALIARKSQYTPTGMNTWLGKNQYHPTIQTLKEQFVPVIPVYNETRYGLQVTLGGGGDGAGGKTGSGLTLTTEELVAMVLEHCQEISILHAISQGSSQLEKSPPKDIVLTVPSYYTIAERRSLLDAAILANMNVLSLIDENTASALQYAMDKTFEDKVVVEDTTTTKDGTKKKGGTTTTSGKQLILFYNMGASSLQVSLVRFYSYAQKSPKKVVPALEVLAKSWDTTLGGNAFDTIIVNHLADAFNKIWKSKKKPDDSSTTTFDIRDYPKAMIKIVLQANKVKHVLSANNEIPVFIDALHDEIPLSTSISRSEFQQLSTDLLQRCVVPVVDVLQQANTKHNLTIANITAIELLGGGMRIPSVQQALTEKLESLAKDAGIDITAKDDDNDDVVEKKKKKEGNDDTSISTTATTNPLALGMHLNSDESMALGAAFNGANISTAFRVRHVGLTDINPFPIQVTLTDLDDDDDSNNNNKKGSGGGLLGGFFGGGNNKKNKDKADGEGGGDGSGGDVSVEGEEGDASSASASAADNGGEDWSKKATIFKANGKLGVKKTIAFTHDSDVHAALDYYSIQEEEEEPAHVVSDESTTTSSTSSTTMMSIPPMGTEYALERYKITGVEEFAKEMASKGLGKPKVSLQFELSAMGITSIVKAEAAVEEMIIVQEEIEVDDDDDESDSSEDDSDDDDDSTNSTTDNTTEVSSEETTSEEEAETESTDDTEEEDSTNSTTTNTTTDAKNETESGDDKKENDKDKKKKKKKKKIMVDKEKKKVHKKALTVKTYYVGTVRPHTDDIMNDSIDKLLEMTRKDKERIELEEMRNKVESYIYEIKNKLIDDEADIGKVTTQEQRDEIVQLSTSAELWMEDDGYTADLATMSEKYIELSEPFEKIKFRIREIEARPKAVEALNKRLTELEALITKWETDKPQITEEERTGVKDQIQEIRTWMTDKEKEQLDKPLHEDPAYNSTEIPLKTKSVEKQLVKLSKKPKPKPEKNKEDNTTSTDGNATTADADGNSTTEESADADADATTTAEDGESEADADADADATTKDDSDEATTDETTTTTGEEEDDDDDDTTTTEEKEKAKDEL